MIVLNQHLILQLLSYTYTWNCRNLFTGATKYFHNLPCQQILKKFVFESSFYLQQNLPKCIPASWSQLFNYSKCLTSTSEYPTAGLGHIQLGNFYCTCVLVFEKPMLFIKIKLVVNLQSKIIPLYIIEKIMSS